MITTAYRKEIRKIFHQYKKTLGIPKHWKISISIDKNIKEYANVEFSYDNRQFDIHINPRLNKKTNVLKDSILHELTHILFAPVTSRLDSLIEKVQNNEKINFKITKKRLIKYEEYLVNRITKIIIAQEKSLNGKKSNSVK